MLPSDVEEAVAGASRLRDAETSKTKRRERGIVHTPAALARFVAGEVDGRLRGALGVRGGIASKQVAVLDPACGTGAFLAAALTVAGGRRGAPRFFGGYEIDASAAAVTREVIGPHAEAAGWPLDVEARDTLASLDAPAAPYTVVLGNPPWAGRSANRDAQFTSDLLEDFRVEAGGKRLTERKVGVLSDDYVRFFRWSAEVVRQSPKGGVLGLVTNASYLDGPIHRAMRAALLRWFDGVDIVDLGGNALIANEGRDDNVFGVRPAVAVTIAWRRAPHGELLEAGRARRIRLRGSTKEKLGTLDGFGEAGGAPYEALAPKPPFYSFGPRPAREDWPEGAVSLPTLMPFHREGVQTNRDAAVIAETRDALVARLEAFVAGESSGALEAASRGSRHYDPDKARAKVNEALMGAASRGYRGVVEPIAYRPFDERVFAPIPSFCHRPRHDLREAMARAPLALLTVRKDRGERAWTHVAVSRAIPDNCYLSNRSSCRTRAFTLVTPEGDDNWDADAVRAWAGRAHRAVSAARLLDFAFAMLSATAYREGFTDLLRADYPALLAPKSRRAFEALADAGQSLRERWLGPVGAGSGDGDEGSEPLAVGHYRVARVPAGVVDALVEVDAVFDRYFGDQLAP